MQRSSPNLDNLVDIGKLKHKPRSLREQQGKFDSAEAGLADDAIDSLSVASRFDLANVAASWLCEIRSDYAEPHCAGHS